jgi:hydrogenase maturation protease
MSGEPQMSAVRPVVVFAIGNPSRGDDAIGPLLFERLSTWLDEEGLADGFDLFEDFQLQIEHAIDLKGRRLALFIDAGDRTPAPYTFRRIAPTTEVAHTSHALAPEAVLQVYRQIEGEAPPPSFVLCVRGEGFALGEPLGASARNAVNAAFAALQSLCLQPTLSAWTAASTAPGSL